MLVKLNTDWAKPRGVSGRRAAMQWIVENWRQKSVLYFGDDDNTYDLRLFEDIRCQFHQHFTCILYLRRSQKGKNILTT
jgi:hypothetical protein